MVRDFVSGMMRFISTSALALALGTGGSHAQEYDAYLQCEDTCKHIHGIDVSHYQGDISWETVAGDSKVSYVYIKASEGAEITDDRYRYNIEAAHRHGLKVGSYHYFRPGADPWQQLENFKSQCRPGDQDLIPMIDIETAGGMDAARFTDSLLRFLGMVEDAYRQKPLLYTGRNFYDKYLAGKVDGYPLMVAMYTDEEPVLADGRDYTIWQYSAKGRMGGIGTHVDKSRFMGRHSMREIKFRHF